MYGLVLLRKFKYSFLGTLIPRVYIIRSSSIKLPPKHANDMLLLPGWTRIYL